MAIKKILVANRSEIACRVFQTARELGYWTVALCAPGDEQARHITYADEVIRVTSYLDHAAIVAEAKKAGVHAIHPGYGFLSERSVFVEAVEKAGMIFLGPTGATMDALGGKIAAKELAEKLGVPTLPWAKINVQGKAKGTDLKSVAQNLGFPILLKAAAGGGGKGMRKVTNESELESAAESASAEAVSAFGDGTLFLERLIEKPRHIEIQVFGDGKGEGVHLFERECTLQRRHQKVWEEAPAPGLSEKTRQGLYEAALKLVRGVKYRSAGTIEFILDEKGSFYFLEMNTRLQVEHPVTEEVTGLDLVRLQIELGLTPEKFSLPEVDAPRGHSIEVRLYAEDPSQGFMPTPGTVHSLSWPNGTGIRVESGIEQGQTIGTGFDSMLAKIIVHAPTREHAIDRMRFALSQTSVLGMGTNQSYLFALSESKQVRAGEVYTSWLEKEFEYNPDPSKEDLELLSQVLSGLSGSSVARAGLRQEAVGSEWSPWQKVSPKGVV